METTPACSAVVVEVLRQDNYLDWSARVKTCLMANDLWDFVESSIGCPTLENEAAFKDWSRTNARALLVIQNSCGTDTFSVIRPIFSARNAWETLARRFGPKALDPSCSMASDPLEEGMLDSSIEPGESDTEENCDVSVEDIEDLKRFVDSESWCEANDFIRSRPNFCSGKNTCTGKTALHIAVEAGYSLVAVLLVDHMSAENLEIIDNEGFTALARAISKGNQYTAREMLRRSRKLLTIQSDKGYIPAVAALYAGNLDFALYLYKLTPPEILMPGNDIGPTVACVAIFNNALDIVLDLLVHKHSLPSVFAQDRNCDSPCYALACMPVYFPSGNPLVFWKRWMYNGIRIPQDDVVREIRLIDHSMDPIIPDGTCGPVDIFNGFKRHLYVMKLTHLRSKELLRLMTSRLLVSSIQEMGIGRVQEAIVRATEEGIFEFVFAMVKVVPSFVWSHDAKSRNIFSVAVQYRRAKIFSLIYQLDFKNILAISLDSTGNNLLHMAGMSAPSTSLDRIAGAALQMQRELQWFQEVESIVPPRVHGQTNNDGFTPRQLFTKNHEDMMSKGEKWMKDTASSCTVVGALIATIMFAAVFTVPGGNDQNKGVPIFLNKKLFLVFIVSDALALFSSSTSVLMFLGILTSRYAEEDFLESLPRKMIIGLSTLFFSIVAMMTTFSAALLLMLHEESWILKPIICLACIPVTLFILMQFPHLVSMAISTYGPSIFDRKMKRWI